MHVGAQSYEVAVLILFYFEQCWCENKSSPVGKRASEGRAGRPPIGRSVVRSPAAPGHMSMCP